MESVDPLLQCCLDPRFKSLSFLPQDKANLTKMNFVKRVTEKVRVINDEFDQKNEKIIELGNLFGNAFRNTIFPNEITIEIQAYQNDIVNPMVNPLSWWKEKKIFLFTYLQTSTRIIITAIYYCCL